MSKPVTTSIEDGIFEILSKPFKAPNSKVEYHIPRQEIAIMTAEIMRAFEVRGYQPQPPKKESEN